MRSFYFALLIILSIILSLSCGTKPTPIYNLTTSIEGEGIILPSGGEYEEGEVVTLTAIPSEHWLFQNWSGQGSGSSNTVTIIMDSDKNVIGIFQQRDFPLTIKIEGEGTVEEQIISSPKTTEYPFETLVQLTPKPFNGWRFVEWSGDVVSTDEVVTVTIDGEVNVTATFERINYPLTITIEGEGTVEQEVVQAKTTEYPYEAMIQLNAIPDPNWEFAEWSGDVTGTDSEIIVEMQDEKEINALFVTIPTVETRSVTNITESSAVTGGNVTSTGGKEVTERGVCVSNSPGGDNLKCFSSGTGLGNFTIQLSELNPGTTYYVTAYAMNAVGVGFASNQKSFTTNADGRLPTVQTTEVTSITSSTAVSGGNVTNAGGFTVTQRGVCVGSNSNVNIGTALGCTDNGTGTGTYTSQLSGLSRQTTYYIRAYATNQVGTSYGQVFSFTTMP